MYPTFEEKRKQSGFEDLTPTQYAEMETVWKKTANAKNLLFAGIGLSFLAGYKLLPKDKELSFIKKITVATGNACGIMSSLLNSWALSKQIRFAGGKVPFNIVAAPLAAASLIGTSRVLKSTAIGTVVIGNMQKN